eukprot:764028-Hanusia_phi.AAC.3
MENNLSGYECSGIVRTCNQEAENAEMLGVQGRERNSFLSSLRQVFQDQDDPADESDDSHLLVALIFWIKTSP